MFFNRLFRPAKSSPTWPQLRLEALDHRCLPSLTPAVNYPVATAPQNIVTADFNNDGRLDLATAGGGTVSVLLGAGDGTFAAARHFGSPSAYGDFAVADFNGDGNTDLVTRYSWGAYDTVGGQIDVLLGNGDGSFQAAQAVPVPDPSSGDPAYYDRVFYGYDSYAPIGMRVADVNGDGRSDLGVAVVYTYFNYYDFYTYYREYFTVLLGTADGSFEPGAGGPENFHPTAAAPYDLNADGRADRVWAGSNGVSVQLGRADGTFAPEMLFPAGQSPWGVAVGDFNGDGRQDVAVVNPGSNDVSVLLNDGDWPDPNLPTVQISIATVAEGNTGAKAAVFTITLSAASDQPVAVTYRTSDETATAGSDYQAASGSVTFAPGETAKTVNVLINGDCVGEPNETFVVNLSSPTNANIADGQGVGTITDDEPRIIISDVSQSEGRKNQTTLFTFTVTLSAAYDQPVTMSFQTVNGTATTSDNDYVATSGTFTFAPGETTKTITIAGRGDSKREGDETFCLDLFGLSSNALFTKNRGIGTILNDD